MDRKSWSGDATRHSRREVLGGAVGAAAIGLTRGARASASVVPTGAEASCRVSAGRLDAMVAAAFANFNKPVLLPDFDATRHGARCDVDLHRLTTTVVVPETGEELKISGLLALPVNGRHGAPVVSWQHGTILSFDQVPSGMMKLADPAYRMTDENDSLETLFNVQRFAGRGYALIAADYVGKGPPRNGRGEAYAVKGVTVATCIAMLDAGLSAMKGFGVTPGGLFLNGWSQGALNTQWLVQELERRKRRVAGAAVASPFNDLNEAWRFWTGAQSFPIPAGQDSYPALPAWISLCMIVALGSYELNYRLKGLMKSAVRPEFHDLATKFWSDYRADFDSSKPFPTGADLLVPGFFDRFTDERNSAFLRQLAANRATYWPYASPIRFHYGLSDEAIHPVMAARPLAAGGGMASGVPIRGASHRGTFLASLYGDGSSLDGKENTVEWFGKLAA